MASRRSDPLAACHVVAVPYPGRGHINPMMNLCKLLTYSKPHLLITFVITEEWLCIIGSEEKPPSIRFATIPIVLPSELGRAADMAGFLEATQTKMTEPFEHLLDRLEAPVSIIIADTFLNWAVDVGNRRNIPVASLWPMPASVFSIFYHFDLLSLNGHFPFEISERGEERVDYIPGISPIRLADLPSVVHLKDQRLLRLVLRIFTNISKVQYLLFTSILELEPQVMNALKQKISSTIYSLGPVIPYFNLETSKSHSTNRNKFQYFEWLDSQPPNSVLYVSLGSFLSISGAQMDEIADGLHLSGVRFLWVARGDTMRLQEKCGQSGRIIPWCDQLKVLSHCSVGGFWTHCGWSSTMEGIFAGVPMITLPILADQTTTSKYIYEDWKIGWDARRQVKTRVLLISEEICKMVKRFMDLESVERKKMTKRARELRKVVNEAVRNGGSSRRNLDSFLNDIMRG